MSICNTTQYLLNNIFSHYSTYTYRYMNLATCDSGLLPVLEDMFILCDITYGRGSVYACMYLPYLRYRTMYPDQVLSRYGIYDTLHNLAYESFTSYLDMTKRRGHAQLCIEVTGRWVIF